MELILIRHAQPAWVKDDRGALDPELTERGHVQARHLAEAAKSWRRKPDLLWCSTATRSQQTAAPLGEALGLEVQTLQEVEEIRLPPDWENRELNVIHEAFVRAKKRTEAEWWDGIPGGETFRHFQERIPKHLEAALATVGVTPAERTGEAPLWNVEDSDRTVALVAHGGTNAVATSHMLGLPQVPWAWERFVMAHAAVTRLRASPIMGAFLFGLREHSDASHVPDGLRSR